MTTAASITSSTEMMLGLLAIVLLSALGYWKPNVIIFMVLGGVSMILGLYWYDVYTTNLGLTVGLMLIAYSFLALGFGFRCLLWRREA